MPAWSPFSKPLADLAADDLQQLEGKSEAWWLEYKTELSNEALAKAVAAFANLRGGWVFLGIDTRPGTNEPVLPPAGVEPSRYTIEQVRQVVNSHLSPVPDLQVRQIALPDGRLVFAIAVEEGVEPPYIRAQDGRIYIRRGEVSEPIDFVKDRAELDRLYDRAERYRQRVDRLLEARRYGRLIARYHEVQLRKRPAPVTPQLSVVLLPVSGWLGAPRAQWRTDRQALVEVAKATIERRPDPRLITDWQHGVWIGPEWVEDTAGWTAMLGLGMDGVAEASWVLANWDAGRVREAAWLPERFLAIVAALYWRHQHDGRLRVLARLQGGDPYDVTAERETQLPPAESWEPDWTLGRKALGSWPGNLASDILTELSQQALVEAALRS